MTHHGTRGTYGSAPYAASYSASRLAAEDEARSARLDELIAREPTRGADGFCPHGHDKQGRPKCLTCKREGMRRRRKA